MTCAISEKFTAGEKVTLPTIAGHRDANYTDCPGDKAYALLPAIRTAVAQIDRPKIAAAAVSAAAFDPTGKGTHSNASVKASMSETAAWTVSVRDATHKLVRTFSGRGAQVAATWDGRDAGGHRLADGSYTVVISATNVGLAASPHSVTVAILTVAPRVSRVRAGLVSPKSTGINSRTTVHYAVSLPGKARIEVLDAAGKTVSLLQDWMSVAGGVHTLAWDGKVAVGKKRLPLTDGIYVLRVFVSDAAGHTVKGSASVTVDSTVTALKISPERFSPGGRPGSTVLSVRLERAARLTVVVSSPSGRVVRRFGLGLRPAGWSKAVWNGRLRSGRAVPRGRYALTISAQNALGTIVVRRSVTLI